MVDAELAQELRELDAVTDGRTATGIVTDVSHRPSRPPVHSEEKIIVEVTLPHTSFEQRFEKPKPPTEQYPFTRIAEQYGQGLVDIDGLVGQKVNCVYDENNNEWSIVDPGDEMSLPSVLWWAQFFILPIHIFVWLVRQYASAGPDEGARVLEASFWAFAVTMIWVLFMWGAWRTIT